jgi:VCBS repeat-containing protein
VKLAVTITSHQHAPLVACCPAIFLAQFSCQRFFPSQDTAPPPTQTEPIAMKPARHLIRWVRSIAACANSLWDDGGWPLLRAHRSPRRPASSRARRWLTFDELEAREMLSGDLVANPAAFSVLHAQPLAGDLSPYASDSDGDPISFSAVDEPAHGTLTVSANGSFAYQSDLAFAGTDTFTYRVTDGMDLSDPATVTITVTNTAPVGQADAYSIHHGDTLDTLLAGLPSLLANDRDPDGDEMLIVTHTDPQHGELNVFLDGNINYTPDPGYTGTDTFSYVLTDGQADSSPVSVSIDVTNQPVVPVDDAYTTAQGNIFSTVAAGAPSLFANDSNPDGDLVQLVGYTQPANGSVTVYADGSFSYAPNSGFMGTDSFTYTVSDGASLSTATATITLTNQPPVAGTAAYALLENQVFDSVEGGGSILINASDPDGNALTATLVASPQHGLLTLDADGQFTFTPDQDYYGSDSFTYEAFDGHDWSNSASVILNIQQGSALQSSVAQDDTYEVSRNITFRSLETRNAPGVLANDSGPTAPLPNIVSWTPPMHGTLDIDADGHVVYTPDFGFVGIDTSVYTLDNGQSATITFHVVDDAPIAQDDGPFFVVANSTFDGGCVLLNDSDPNGDPLHIASVAAPPASEGTVVMAPGGSFTFTAAPGYAGPVDIAYTVADDLGENANATLHLYVGPEFDWTGLGDGRSWTDANNWTGGASDPGTGGGSVGGGGSIGGGVPDANSDVHIPAGATVDLSGTAEVYDLYLGGQLNLSGSLQVHASSVLSGDLEQTGELIISSHAIVTVSNIANISGSVVMRTEDTQFVATATDPDHDMTLTNASVSGQGTFIIDGAASVIGTTHALRTEMRSGELNGTGTLVVDGTFTWYGGSWGCTVSLPNDTTALELTGDDAKVIAGGALDSYGTVTISNPQSLTCTQATITNRAGALIDVQDSLWITGSGSTFTNTGVLLFEDGESCLTFVTFTNNGEVQIADGDEIRVTIAGGTFNNPGNMAIDSGQLFIQSSGSADGTFSVASGATVDFDALNFTLNAGSSLTGDGAASFTNGINTINGSYNVHTTSIQNATAVFNRDVTLADVLLGGGDGGGAVPRDTNHTQSQGTLSGTGTFTVTGSMVWATGTMTGGGKTVIADGATLSLSNQEVASPKFLGANGQTRDLRNEGRIFWYGGNLTLNDSDLINAAGGQIFLFGGDCLLGVGTEWNLINEGTLTKEVYDGPTGSSDPPSFYGNTVSSPGESDLAYIENTGTVQVACGTLKLRNGWSSTPINADAGAVVQFAGHFAFDAGASLTGGGLFRIAADVMSADYALLTVDEGASITATNMELQATGMIAGPGTLIIQNRLDWLGGSMTGTGTTTIGNPATFGSITRQNAPILYLAGDSTRYLTQRILNVAALAIDTDGQPVSRRLDTDTWESFYDRSQLVSWESTLVNNAWGPYQQEIQDARGATTGYQAQTLFGQEWQAYVTYAKGETRLAGAFADADQRIEADYQLAALYARRLGADDGTAFQAAAADQYEQAMRTAGDTYADAENGLYSSYLAALDQVRGLSSGSYGFAVQRALFNYQQAVRQAGHWGVPNAQAQATLIHDGLVNNRQNVAGLLMQGGEESRAAVAVAYRRLYNSELTADIDRYVLQSLLQALRGINPAQDDKNYLHFGQRTNPQGAGDTDRSGPLSLIDSWVTSAGQGIQWVGSLTWNDVTSAAATVGDAASNAWVATSQFASNTVQMMYEDPVGFMVTAGRVYRNYQIVVANTFTFGLIPALDQRAQTLMQEHNFYRVVQIGAVVGRELAIQAAMGVLTAGVGNVALTTGRAAASAALRFGGIGAARSVLTASARLGCAAATAQRLTSPIMLATQVNSMVTNVANAREAIARGDGWRGAELFAQCALQLPGMVNSFRQAAQLARAASGIGPVSLRDYLTNCFAAGTPIQGEFGARPIESIQPGDHIWARAETDAAAPVALQVVEECFVSDGPIWHLHIGGQVIRTTALHPFWVAGKGWTSARDLHTGDRLVGRHGTETAIEEIYDTGDVERVYNLRIAEYHTYFVGGDDWGFDVWAHNICAFPRYDARWRARIRGISWSKILGTAQRTGNGNTPHARIIQRMMYRVANNERIREEVGNAGNFADFSMNRQSYITLNRNLRTALGGPPPPQNFFSAPATNLRPDAVVVQWNAATGKWRLSIIEVASPKQQPVDLANRAERALRALGQRSDLELGSVIATDVDGKVAIVRNL